MKSLLVMLVVAVAGHAHAHDLWLEKEGGGVGLHSIPFQSEEAYPYRMQGECAVAHVSISSGYWTKTPYGTQNLPKNQARMPLRSWLSHDSVKRIDHWAGPLARPLAGGLELTPLEDPLSLRKGEKLRLQVTFDGTPVEDAVVAYDGKPRGRPGADGRINIRVRHGGFQVIQATLTRSIASEKADEVIYSTHLNFELPEE
jgi:nickel transport protein